ncbi:zinc metalloprotease HtpX [Periweissella fabaria]|uniref:Protease HtpX homolog n=1 Tax=Periweissella fabaria TaxID=546157 RepID=A0ABM8Z9H6_9LACO|nr:zinc metalloprotease HtpX [Periweissella fabaria]MCM0597909.1 zinc metalloprotease HtpX [Periweissella fabaria]CAH0417361.1 Protease HtpX [Periweissella fabaria]
MLFEQIAQNKRRTVYLLVGFMFLVVLVGAAIGYMFFRSAMMGAILAIIAGGIYAWLMIEQSTEIVMSMNNAQEVTAKEQAPQLWNIVEDMALVAQVPMPRVFIIDDPSPNAFATGSDPKHAAVAATSGILERLTRDELEGVMAHEMAHVRNYDIRISTIAIALTAIISMLANFGSNFMFFGGVREDEDERDNNGGMQIFGIIFSILLIIFGPIAATIVQMAISRNREYLADATAVELTRNPQGLINALKKIAMSEPMESADPSSAALYIENPLKGKSAANLFSTHPATEDRIDRLEHM